MVATSGDRLLDPDAEAVIREQLLPLATLVTPNLDEAAILAGPAGARPPVDGARRAAACSSSGAGAALVKGGHLPGDDAGGRAGHRATASGTSPTRASPTTSTHGTGCTLSAAITAGLALGRDRWTSR